MAKIISSFTIASYRGIHNLTVDQLNDINLIVGLPRLPRPSGRRLTAGDS